MIKVLRKLKGRSLTELRVRGAQAAACLAERAGVSAATRLPAGAEFFALIDASRFGSDTSGAPLTPESLHAHFRTRPAQTFFAAFNAPDATRDALATRFGGKARAALVERAERTVAGRFDLLGLRELDFGDPVDWHLEPVAGKRTPASAHWSRIDYLDASVAGDKKITWELNRQQYFMVLGRAYWHTNDERYAETFARHLASWMDANPPKRGINWASSLEVAFRAIAWLWSLQFFKHSPHLDAALYTRALKFLHAHARHLETNLSTYFSPNTHLTGEALALVYLGTLLPEFRAASRWRETGTRILHAELHRQVRPDGVYFEQTSYYQRYTADFYLHFLALLGTGNNAATHAAPEGATHAARLEDATRAAFLEEKLQALLDHLMYITSPDGTTPLFGDDDGGRLAPFDERAPNDFRATLATGATLFRRADYKFVAREATEETLWLLGAQRLHDFDALHAEPPAQQSRAFTDGGYYVMRDGWTSDSSYLLLDCGTHGTLGGAHAHADALAILGCTARGFNALVDSGTHTYTGSPALRDEFRGTAAHNTLTVDGESSSVPESAFRWRQMAGAACHRWLSHARFDLFEGEHDGYMRLAAPAKHLRSVLFIKGDYWIMRDRVESEGAHRYELNFHFNPCARVSIETGNNDGAAMPSNGAGAETASSVVRAREEDAPRSSALDLFAFARGGAWRAQDKLISAVYGAATPAPACTFAFPGDAAEAVMLLVPRAASAQTYTANAEPHIAAAQPDLTGAARYSAREIEAVGGRAFELKNEGASASVRDFVLMRAGGAHAVETARVVSDFEWTWLRFDGDEAEPRELIAVGGRTLRLDGREVLQTRERVNYFVARQRKGDAPLVETDASEDFFLALFNTVTSDK